MYPNSHDGKLGVTLYLNDMDKHFAQGKNTVPNWISDYRQLKKLRNMRNERAHSQGSFSYLEFTQEDVDFLRKFYEKILNGTDPLALINKKNCTLQSTANNSPASDEKLEQQQSAAHDNLIVALILIFIILAIIVQLYAISCT